MQKPYESVHDRQKRRQRNNNRVAWFSAILGMLLIAAIVTAGIMNPEDRSRVLLLPAIVLIGMGIFFMGRKPR